MGTIGGFLIVIWLILLAMYFAPLIVAISRHHHQTGAIVVINVFLGWTLVGWVVAMAMACSATLPPSAQTIVNVNRDPPQEATTTCPQCGETIKAAARVCRFCNSTLSTAANCRTPDGEAQSSTAARSSTPASGQTAEAALAGTSASRAASRVCANCQSENETTARYCSECGSALSGKEERLAPISSASIA